MPLITNEQTVCRTPMLALIRDMRLCRTLSLDVALCFSGGSDGGARATHRACTKPGDFSGLYCKSVNIAASIKTNKERHRHLH